MASTNKTTHYDLSQYVGSDKPTYLTDYNNDMSAIDTGIYNAQTKADSAYSSAGIADGKADTALQNAGTALNNANTALTNIGNMANLETTDKTALVNAINELKNIINNINLTSFSDIDVNDFVLSGGATLHGASIHVAKNSDGSLAKIYGTISLKNVTATNGTLKFPTTLRPSSDITIDGGMIRYHYNTAGDRVANMSLRTFTIKTNGDIEIPYTWALSSGEEVRFMLINSLIFVKDFGDIPVIN